jgi:hypothetical protein
LEGKEYEVGFGPPQSRKKHPSFVLEVIEAAREALEKDNQVIPVV